MISDEQQLIIDKAAAFVKATLLNAEGGHDWFHIYRVWKNAIALAKEETADMFVVQLAALLHDIADAKFHNGDDAIGPATAGKFLLEEGVESNVVHHVQNIIANISFKGGQHTLTFNSKELDIVQDADRLDAIGAIGIARAFSYGGFKNRRMYDPEIRPTLNMDQLAYRNSQAPTINHFYEKLLLLKDRMNTAAGKKMAERRHEFMKEYLEQFYAEWEGVR
ncbi:MAG TPA: HD domain-containing protein [Flavitalea sp.]|nr:HD domain-containing protein [Flavitalea sp.]